MTIARLHKLLGKLIADGHGRTNVAIYRDTFRWNGMPEITHHEVSGVNVELIPVIDDDGWTKINADGRERHSITAVLFGQAGFVRDGHVRMTT